MKLISQAAVFLCCLGLVILLQIQGGAYAAEFGGEPDEAAHYVTGMMVRDYLATRPALGPVAFAENFYLHYPKVAFGIWPPLFHLVEGVWFLLFSPSRTAALALIALCAAGLAWIAYRMMSSQFGPWAGLAAAVLLVATPAVQAASGLVMMDLPLALISAGAVLAFGRYLDSHSWRDSAWFGLLAAAAILTKYNGLALAFVPPLGLLFSGQLRLLRDRRFWLPLVIVVVLCGPWYVAMWRWVSYASEPRPTWSSVWPAMGHNAGQFAGIAGVGLFAFVVVGLATKGRTKQGIWAAALAWLLSIWGFHSVLYPISETRYLLGALPALLFFAGAGIRFVAKRLPLPRLSIPQRTLMVGTLLAGLFCWRTFWIPYQVHYGFMEATQDILARPEWSQALLLISSEGNGEGMLVAEMATLEPRPGHIVLRASKILSRSTWMSLHYELLFRTPGQALARLDELPIGLLVIDTVRGPTTLPHHEQLLRMINQYPDRFQQVGAYPHVTVYAVAGNVGRPHGPIQINLDSTLGRTIRN